MLSRADSCRVGDIPRGLKETRSSPIEPAGVTGGAITKCHLRTRLNCINVTTLKTVTERVVVLWTVYQVRRRRQMALIMHQKVDRTCEVVIQYNG